MQRRNERAEAISIASRPTRRLLPFIDVGVRLRWPSERATEHGCGASERGVERRSEHTRVRVRSLESYEFGAAGEFLDYNAGATPSRRRFERATAPATTPSRTSFRCGITVANNSTSSSHGLPAPHHTTPRHQSCGRPVRQRTPKRVFPDFFRPGLVSQVGHRLLLDRNQLSAVMIPSPCPTLRQRLSNQCSSGPFRQSS